MKCPRCGSIKYIKAGRVCDKQRYRCKDCGYHFTINNKSRSMGVKRLALILYLEGLGYKRIAALLNVSPVAVYKWLKPLKKYIDIYRVQEKNLDGKLFMEYSTDAIHVIYQKTQDEEDIHTQLILPVKNIVS